MTPDDFNSLKVGDQLLKVKERGTGPVGTIYEVMKDQPQTFTQGWHFVTCQDKSTGKIWWCRDLFLLECFVLATRENIKGLTLEVLS